MHFVGGFSGVALEKQVLPFTSCRHAPRVLDVYKQSPRWQSTSGSDDESNDTFTSLVLDTQSSFQIVLAAPLL
jgi:hypothetical protein